MKILNVYLRSSKGNYTFNFRNECTDKIHTEIVLTGINGCGKTTILRLISSLWLLAHQWVVTGVINRSSVEDLVPFNDVAVVYDLENDRGNVGVFIGSREFIDSLKKANPDVIWVGEQRESTGTRVCTLNVDAHHKLSTTTAQRVIDVNTLIPHSCKIQTAALSRMRSSEPDLYQEVMEVMNRYLSGKTLTDDFQIRLDSGAVHGTDNLSYGELRALSILYALYRYAEPDSVLLIDNPDFHMHVSDISPFLADVGILVDKRNCQLITTTHNPLVVDRFVNLGLHLPVTPLRVTDAEE